MKKKIIFSLIILLLISSCGKKEIDNSIENNTGSIKNININETTNNIRELDNNNSSIEKIVDNQENNTNNDLLNDEKMYINFEKLENNKIISYDCKQYKTSIYQRKCLEYKNIVNYVLQDKKNSELKEDKLKILNSGDLSYCEKFLKNKNDEYGDLYSYYNCSLAMIILNDKISCKNLKNKDDFKIYFGKTCDEIVVNLNNYINMKLTENQYKQMINGFWGQEDILDFNENIEEIYLNQILNKNNDFTGGGVVSASNSSSRNNIK